MTETAESYLEFVLTMLLSNGATPPTPAELPMWLLARREAGDLDGILNLDPDDPRTDIATLIVKSAEEAAALTERQRRRMIDSILSELRARQIWSAAHATPPGRQNEPVKTKPTLTSRMRKKSPDDEK